MALRAEGAGLTVTTLRSAEEIRQPEVRTLPEAPAEMVQLLKDTCTDLPADGPPPNPNDDYVQKCNAVVEEQL